ncbi:hypothetical protein DWB61_05510 [Ancylomarina euxinus]|uniref:Uncharacterized protein n=1 Tax=Ancylomarina euxinus TaxID=2283627 RepID=A0A425Y459_9BACT|nr:hypothetical protein [Ancylomarina euxinus]MCZ4694493.1 hypothetical protein [Ancylomarina euxinus]MUP14036.1 hypothetical protein [Ancylomarina euxinus]RRG22896.1 hypothetical protein DWB61_05510 [Ancylomarina euxinus]
MFIKGVEYVNHMPYKLNPWIHIFIAWQIQQKYDPEGGGCTISKSFSINMLSLQDKYEMIKSIRPRGKPRGILLIKSINNNLLRGKIKGRITNKL